MGRFETAAEFYRYREPYPPDFFTAVAIRLALNGQTRMLDVGCGPGNLAIGFAPYVGNCTAVDIEPAMLAVARANAAAANVNITFIAKPIEDLDSAKNSFDFLTIGRALHWLPRESTLSVFEQVVAPNGCIAVCSSTADNSPVNAWTAEFKRLRLSVAADRDEARYRPDLDQWFAASSFRKLDEVSVTFRHSVNIADLVSRALSYSVTSPSVLGDKRPEFEAELESALTPFATEGAVEEELLVKATLFVRPSA